MSPEKERAIYERWPSWFRSAGNPHSGMSHGFLCGDGWYGVVYQLLVSLEPLVAASDDEESFEVVQVKQRFGELRVHVNHYGDEILATLASACELSRRTCEVCGNPGSLEAETTRLWKTLCLSCREADEWWR